PPRAPNVRFTSNSGQTLAPQQNAASCQKRPVAGPRHRHRRHLVCPEMFGRFEPSVCFLEHSSRSLAVGPMLLKRQRVPLTSFSGKKVATVNMNGASQAIDRVENRMNDIGTKRLGISFAKRLCANCLDLARRSTNTPPENVVLASGVDADHRP